MGPLCKATAEALLLVTASSDIASSFPDPCHSPPRASAPVFASLLLEELIELQHLVARDHEGLQPGQHLAQELQVVVDLALAVAPHVAAGAPEDEHGALAHVEQVMTVAEDPLDAGMRDDPQAGTIAHVPPEAARGCIVHADDALRLVDLRALPAVQQMTRARHQCTVPAVHSQGLEGGGRKAWLGQPTLGTSGHWPASEGCPFPRSRLNPILHARVYPFCYGISSPYILFQTGDTEHWIRGKES